nr:pyridoxal-phosphate dependent enzyme [Filomicrobium insigne]
MTAVGSEPCYSDPVTGRHYALGDPRWRSDDGHPLSIIELCGLRASEIDVSERSLWRYRKALPIPIANPVCLGEGVTPLIQRTWNGRQCHFKLEWFAPTGSFKDRGASVMVSFLRQLGIAAILEDSSGNGGAAIAAYGAAAGMRVKILAPANAQPPKIAQIKAYGAEVQLVEGPREATEAEAIRQSSEVFYASHNWHPFFLQGTKTLGYELWEDLGFHPPDNIIIPTGAGSNVLGCDLAFTELMRADQIHTLPRLFAAQPENCAPIHAHYQADRHAMDALHFAPTVAEGASIKNPVRLGSVLKAIRRSGGNTVAVSEAQIVAACRGLAAQGLYVEPTSAVAAAAFDLLCRRGEIGPDETTVAVLTGSGLKASAFMTELFSH